MWRYRLAESGEPGMTRNEIIAQLYPTGEKVASIAHRCGCDPSRVSILARRMGLKMRRPDKPHADFTFTEQMEICALEGKLYGREVGEIYGVPAPSIYAIWRRWRRQT